MEKLVRDLIPELFPQHEYRRASSEGEKLKLLGEKLVEEAREVLEALRNPQETEALQEELADVLEVLYTLVGTMEFSVPELGDVMDLKARTRGSFDEGWVLIWSAKED